MPSPVVALCAPGCTFWPARAAGLGRRPLVVEWWLMSAEGDLIEAYWLER